MEYSIILKEINLKKLNFFWYTKERQRTSDVYQKFY